MFAAESYLQLLSDPAHWLMELTVEVFTGILLYPLGKRLVNIWVDRHDRRHHDKTDNIYPTDAESRPEGSNRLVAGYAEGRTINRDLLSMPRGTERYGTEVW